MGQLERDPAEQVQLDRHRDRHSWTGTSYSHETGSRPTGFSYVYKYLLVPSRIDSNKQCFHNQYMHTCLLRATWCTPVRCTLMRCTPVRCTLMRCTPVRCTFMRYTPMR